MTERRHRRVRTPPAPGSDPLPGSEPEQPDSTEQSDSTEPSDSTERSDRDESNTAHSNDEQLRRDVPPHWHDRDSAQAGG